MSNEATLSTREVLAAIQSMKDYAKALYKAGTIPEALYHSLCITQDLALAVVQKRDFAHVWPLPNTDTVYYFDIEAKVICKFAEKYDRLSTQGENMSKNEQPKLRVTDLNMRTKTFTAELDYGPGYEAALKVLGLPADYDKVIDVVGNFYVQGSDYDDVSAVLDGSAFVRHPKTGAEVSFEYIGLDDVHADDALAEASQRSTFAPELYAEYAEYAYAAAESAWESYNDR